MKTTYISPCITAIEIDLEISLQYQSEKVVTEPGSGGAGIGGVGNDSGEGGWTRVEQYSPEAPAVQDFNVLQY
jgi:hypothetical protein